jgi:hypothetical protein
MTSAYTVLSYSACREPVTPLHSDFILYFHTIKTKWLLSMNQTLECISSYKFNFLENIMAYQKLIKLNYTTQHILPPLENGNY